jgi:hypothetical protein
VYENPNFIGTPCRFGGGQPLSIDSLEKLIDKAFTPKKLEAVFLSINSPGGSPVQSELIVRSHLILKKGWVKYKLVFTNCRPIIFLKNPKKKASQSLLLWRTWQPQEVIG